MLPITKMYIDARYRTSDSTSSSDFKVELPETITLPRGTKAYITDVSIPNTMTTITEGFNDTLYFADVGNPTLSRPLWQRFSRLQDCSGGGKLHCDHFGRRAAK